MSPRCGFGFNAPVGCGRGLVGVGAGGVRVSELVACGAHRRQRIEREGRLAAEKEKAERHERKEKRGKRRATTDAERKR